jgi:hypothetical protein
MGVRSVIDIRLWEQAGWDGIAYLGERDQPPTIAFRFTDQAAAQRIFERWRERFGADDTADDIYLGFIREIFAKEPFSYRVLITSRPRPGDVLSIFTSRFHTMNPTSSEGLDGFLKLYRQMGAYDIMPAISKPSGAFAVGRHLSIRKRALGVKRASEVTDKDIELVALPRGADQEED